ncbi:NAC domain-containing protein 78 [Linum perenne]
MCPPTLNPIADIGFDGTPEEICKSLHKLMRGSPLPSNVVDDVSPYLYAPSNLPADIWYFISKSVENKDTGKGFWKMKGESLKLFTDSMITGWRSTLEYYEGEEPKGLKTDWLMQQYWVSEKDIGESSKAKESSSLCRVFLDRDHVDQKREGVAAPLVPDEAEGQRRLITSSVSSSGSTSKAEGDRDDVADVWANILQERYAGGDYLEMLDLAIPASSSSSTDNSSCMSLSSDEYFDSLALLREIESDSIQDSVQRNGESKLNVSTSCKPEELIMNPGSPGLIMSIQETKPSSEQATRTGPSSSVVADQHKDQNDKVHQKQKQQQGSRKHKLAHKDKGSSSDSSHGGSSSGACRDGEKKGSKGTIKRRKNKYLCFMPFNFIF